MKIFKRYSAALKANAGSDAPILRVGKLYFVFEPTDCPPELCEFSVLRKSAHGHTEGGHITVRHLERLGNGNWAEKGGVWK